MSTSQSPLRKIKAEADRCAAKLKSMERGEPVEGDPLGKVAAALERPSITFGVVMDDKVLKIEMPWTAIRGHSEASLSEFILRHMRGAREAVH